MTAIVSGLLEKSGSLLVEGVWPELKSFLCFQKEVRKLESTLRAIQAVLEDADKRQLEEVAVKLWLDKLKEAAYDVDNVLDEVETAIIKAKIEEEEEKAETTTANAKVWSSCTTCISWIFRVVTELVQRGFIVFKIKNLNETLDEIDKEKGRYNFVFGPITSTEVGERRGTYSRVNVKEIHGRDEDGDDLVRKILREGSEVRELSGEGSEVRGSEGERSPYVISIVGMGGIGKTTLAKLAYAKVQTKHEVQTALFDEKMWVCVSNPFDVCRIAKAIIKGCGGSANSIELEELLNEMCELIRAKKFLLVLDDVWTENPNDWEPFKLALKCGDLGSRILITTRNIRVAEMVKSAYTINLGVLSDEDCWLICSHMASIEKDDEQLGELGRVLAKKCKGLPLAAKTLGSLMHIKRSRQQWKNILDSKLWELEDVKKGLLGPLLLSYYEQPLAIKSCFLYCALFPKDYLFSRNELIHLWMSQGYLGVNPNIEMENIGEEYFEILVMRSFFQDFEKDYYDGKIVRCKMHDIVHDFAQLMTSKECFPIDGDKDSGTNCKSARHLRLELIGETQFPMSMYNAKNVRTFFFITLGKGTVFPLNLFQHLTCLRALTLKSYSFENLPNEVEKLIHLRLLNLSDNDKIKELPETMCNLCNLQTLNISGCSKITKLPQRMGKLKKLRHLVARRNSYSYSYLTKPFPKGVGRLSSLRTLEKFIIGGIDDSKGCKLGELKNLNHLKGSLTIEGLENVTDVQEAENAQLKDKRHLRELRLSFVREDEEIESVRNDEIVLKALEPHPNLEILKIDYYMGRVHPNWMMSLSNLKMLKLWMWPNLEQLPPLGKLQFLETLELEGAYSVKKVGVEFLGIEKANGKNGSTSSLVLFPNLKSLQFWDMKKWEEWDGIGGTMREEEAQESGVTITIMPRLQELQIKFCPKLKSLPDFLSTTPLKTLQIYNCPILSECCKTEIGEFGRFWIMPRLQILDISECPKLKALPNFLEATSLKELSVDCRISNWMTLATLSGLKTLRLTLNNNVEHLPPLGKLLLVESLEIWRAHRVKKVGVEFLGIEEESNNNNKIDDEKGSTSSSSSSSLVLFPNLKSLKFYHLKEWEEWDGIGGTMREEEAQESGVTITIMPRLQSLKIWQCPKLKSLPDFLPTTPLKNLDFIMSPILSECCKTEKGDQWPKISHIPNIEIDDTYVRRDGRPMQT